MSERHSDRDLEARIVARLDADAERLDARTRRRLDRARIEALDAADRPGRAFPGWPAAAAVGAAALVVAVLVLRPDDGIPAAPRSPDLDLLTSEEFELFADDPAFYAWLAALGDAADDAEERS